MKKFLIFITLVAILLACATLAVNAEEVVAEETVEVTLDEAVEEAPITAEMVKDFILTNLDKICSAMSFALCAVLAWLYKKGFLPYLSNGLKQLGGALSATKDGLTKVVDANREDVAKAVEAFDKGVNAINDMAVKFEELQKLYEAQEQEKAKLEAKVKRSDEINLLTCQMIKEIFVNTNIPQYLKDSVNTYYAEAIAHIDALEKAVTRDENVS